MKKTVEKKLIKVPNPIYCYSPKQTPRLDSDGNIIGYDTPLALPTTLQNSDSIRVKNHCNEIGLSADPNNVTGFRRCIDLINQNRNVSGSGLVMRGCDDLDIMQLAASSVASLVDSNV